MPSARGGRLALTPAELAVDLRMQPVGALAQPPCLVLQFAAFAGQLGTAFRIARGAVGRAPAPELFEMVHSFCPES
jgi:hypothetical protein